MSHQAQSMITDYVLHDKKQCLNCTDFRHHNLFSYHADYEVAFFMKLSVTLQGTMNGLGTLTQ